MENPAGQWILHVDLDQFVVGVELRRRPELRGLPVVVGGSGDPTERRVVVICASYEARAHGVRAGMPMRTAGRRCPEAVFLPKDGPSYERASDEVMAALRALPVDLEVLGWDEAFLGVRTDDPEEFAAEVRRVVADSTGLSCSVGVGENTSQAKLATGFGKPAGVFRIDSTTWADLMFERPVSALWGVGSRLAERLAGLGVRTIGELAAVDEEMLVAEFGPRMGPWYGGLGRGEGETRIVTEPRVASSRSRSKTYAEDLTGRAEIETCVAELADEIAREVVDQGRAVRRVAVTVRNASFHTDAKVAKLPEPSKDVTEIVALAVTLLGRFELKRPVRLLGVRLELD